MPPVIAVVGNSDSGKTRVASALVRHLSAMGYRVAAVKHCPHGHQVDRPHSDTDRLYRAGAAVVVAASPDRLTRMERAAEDRPLEDIATALAKEVDLVVAEGFKDSHVPKVLVSDGGPWERGTDGFVAVVGPSGLFPHLPHYTFDSLDRLAEDLRRRLLDGQAPGPRVALRVDGRPVPLSRYPSLALAQILRGFVASLRGVPEDPSEIEVEVQLKSR